MTVKQVNDYISFKILNAMDSGKTEIPVDEIISGATALCQIVPRECMKNYVLKEVAQLGYGLSNGKTIGKLPNSFYISW